MAGTGNGLTGFRDDWMELEVLKTDIDFMYLFSSYIHSLCAFSEYRYESSILLECTPNLTNGTLKLKVQSTGSDRE